MENMMKHNEKKIIQLIREEYRGRILDLYKEAARDLVEADMFDDVGNQLLSPGLKIRHKKSGYEYTVDHVEGQGENAVVYLRHPEVPRFKPPHQETQLTEGDEDELPNVKVDQVDLKKVMGIEGEVNDMPSRSGVNSDPLYDAKKNMSGSLLKVTKKDFEKEYEVK
jgi:hypothetical protein